jgi:hypothetical protein
MDEKLCEKIRRAHAKFHKLPSIRIQSDTPGINYEQVQSPASMTASTSLSSLEFNQRMVTSPITPISVPRPQPTTDGTHLINMKRIETAKYLYTIGELSFLGGNYNTSFIMFHRYHYYFPKIRQYVTNLKDNLYLYYLQASYQRLTFDGSEGDQIGANPYTKLWNQWQVTYGSVAKPP